jgi:hypothetical protein
MLILLSALLSTLGSLFRSRAVLELEHMALRHQIGVLKRSARKRPKLTPSDRLLWVLLSRVWGDWRSALDIVKPDVLQLPGVAGLVASSDPKWQPDR